MSIVFYRESNEGTAGYDEVNIGKGILAANVALQGFYMTYGENSEHDLVYMDAQLSEPKISENEQGDTIFKYRYNCGMYDKNDNVGSGSINSLILTEIGS